MIKKSRDLVLELKNVSLLYKIGDQKIIALDRVNFQVEKGEFVSVMGVSGSGKSSFLQVASTLAQPTSGEIFINGKNVTSYNQVESARLRNKEIGFIFQSFNLLKKTTALENVGLPLVYAKVSDREIHKRAKEILTRLGLEERLKNTPAQLSGGQQQRVAIARALINNPTIIFADEPTGNLDSKSGKEVEKILKDLHQQGKTIVLVTHEKKVASIAQRLVEIKDGKIISDKKIITSDRLVAKSEI